MGGGSSRQSYEEYVKKRRNKELLFIEDNTTTTIIPTNIHQPKLKWGRHLSMRNGRRSASSDDGYSSPSELPSTSMLITTSNNKLESTPPPRGRSKSLALTPLINQNINYSKQQQQQTKKHAGFLTNRTSSSSAMSLMDGIEKEQPRSWPSSPTDSSTLYNMHDNNNNSSAQPKYALVRRKSKNSDITRTAIKKLK